MSPRSTSRMVSTLLAVGLLGTGSVLDETPPITPPFDGMELDVRCAPDDEPRRRKRRAKGAKALGWVEASSLPKVSVEPVDRRAAAEAKRRRKAERGW